MDNEESKSHPVVSTISDLFEIKELPALRAVVSQVPCAQGSKGKLVCDATTAKVKVVGIVTVTERARREVVEEFGAEVDIARSIGIRDNVATEVQGVRAVQISRGQTLAPDVVEVVHNE